MTDIGVAVLACVAGPLLVGGVMAVKAKRKRLKDQPKRARAPMRSAAFLNLKPLSVSLIDSVLEQAGAPTGKLLARVAWLAEQHAKAQAQQLAEREQHAAVLRDRDADAAMLQRDIRELLQPPPGVDLGPISSVKCLVDAYATLRAEMRKTQPAVVVAVEGALWRAWGQDVLEKRRDIASLFTVHLPPMCWRPLQEGDAYPRMHCVLPKGHAGECGPTIRGD